MAQHLHSIHAPYNTNVAAHVAGLAALESRAWLTEKIAVIKAERARLALALAALPGLAPLPSDANFFLVHVAAGQARRLYEALLERGIMIRYFRRADLRDYIRISIGTPEQNTRLLDALHELTREG